MCYDEKRKRKEGSKDVVAASDRMARESLGKDLVFEQRERNQRDICGRGPG
jgi:hypothetical protein